MNKDKKENIGLIISILSFCATIFFGLRAEGWLHFEKFEVVERVFEASAFYDDKKLAIINALISIISAVLSQVFSSRRQKLKEKKEEEKLQYIDKEYKKNKLVVNAHYENQQKVILTVQNKNQKPIFGTNMVVAINHLNEVEKGLPYVSCLKSEISLDNNMDKKTVCCIDLNQFSYQFDVIILWNDPNYDNVKRSFCIRLK